MMEVNVDFNYDLSKENSDYTKLCEMILKLADSEELKTKLESVLLNGTFNGYSPNGDIGRDNAGYEIDRRLSLAFLLLNNPETFDEVVRDNIIYFHGTNSNALPSILKYGISSSAHSSELGIPVTTGEEAHSVVKGRNFVSFTDVLSLAQGYSRLKPNQNNELSFPIVFGTTKENILSSRFRPVDSDLPEVGVCNNITLDKVNCMMVPPEKVGILRTIVADKIKVYPIANNRECFFTSLKGEIYIDYEEYEKYKNGYHHEEKTLKGVKESVLKRSLSNIKKILNRENKDEHRNSR